MVVVAIVVVVEEGRGKHNTVAGRNGFILSCCRVVDSILGELEVRRLHRVRVLSLASQGS
jgi:hypothetical protein